MRIRNFKKGFTLIELLIVIAIIGVLAALLMANFIGVRQRGRDAQRKSDIRQIQSALEMYRADQGSYPAALANCSCSGSSCLGNTDCTTIYMQKNPSDPTSGDAYSYTPSGTPPDSYEIVACLENGNDPQKDAVKNGSCTTASITLQNP